MCKRYINRKYKTLSVKGNNISDNRHYLPYNKEWYNSTFNYNIKGIIDIPFIDKYVNSLIKSYLNLIPSPKKKTKSKRTRNFLRRSTTKKLFITRSEIKQSYNKATFTIYVFDREKQFINRKLFLLSLWIDKCLDESKTMYFLGHNIQNYRVKFENLQYNLCSSIIKKILFLKTIFFYKFLKWALSIFEIKVNLLVPTNKKGKPLIAKIKKLNVKDNKFSFFIKLNKPLTTNILRNFDLINTQLLTLLLKKLKLVSGFSYKYETDLNFIFKKFLKAYYDIFLIKILKKEFLGLSYLIKLYISIQKFGKLLPLLKTFLKKIYNKKIELNLVNLKYLHLNAEMYSEAISTKIRKRKSVLLRVLKNSVNLVEIPRIKNKKVYNNALMYNINYKKSSNPIKDNSDQLYILLTEMFIKLKKNLISPWESNKQIINYLKYKWNTGVRVEAKGRLSKRFTASRSVFKHKYKGSLRNLEHLLNKESLKKLNEKKKYPSVFLVRSEYRPNVQHAFIASKRRIGAFGIKGWISNN